MDRSLLVDPQQRVFHEQNVHVERLVGVLDLPQLRLNRARVLRHRRRDLRTTRDGRVYGVSRFALAYVVQVYLPVHLPQLFLQALHQCQLLGQFSLQIFRFFFQLQRPPSTRLYRY